jgi:HAD superfamily hydrolase (TIGR01509 family)
MKLRRLRGLIFDMDGTLADTEEVHRWAFNRAFEALGLPVNWDVAEHRRRLPQGSGRERLALLFAEPPLAERFPDPAERERMIVRLHETKTNFFGEAIDAGRAELRPGVARLLAAAREAGLKTAVASTAHRRSVNAILRNKLPADLVAGLSAVYGGGDVINKKPHPEVYLRCLSDMGLKAGEAVAFEDSRIGLTSALAARLTTVVTHTHWTQGQDFTGAALVTDCLGDPPPTGPSCRLDTAPPALGRPAFLALEHFEALLGTGEMGR